MCFYLKKKITFKSISPHKERIARTPFPSLPLRRKRYLLIEVTFWKVTESKCSIQNGETSVSSTLSKLREE